MMSFPERQKPGGAAFRLAFKYFRRVEGTFRVNRRRRWRACRCAFTRLDNPAARTHTVSL